MTRNPPTQGISNGFGLLIPDNELDVRRVAIDPRAGLPVVATSCCGDGQIGQRGPVWGNPDIRVVGQVAESGAPTNPDWYHSPKAHPRITVEVSTAIFPVEADLTGGSGNRHDHRAPIAHRQ